MVFTWASQELASVSYSFRIVLFSGRNGSLRVTMTGLFDRNCVREIPSDRSLHTGSLQDLSRGLVEGFDFDRVLDLLDLTARAGPPWTSRKHVRAPGRFDSDQRH